MLSVKNIAASYGHVQALSEVSLEVAERGTVTLIGSNGAGKSTLLKVISGLAEAHEGHDRVPGGADRWTLPGQNRGRGIAHCPEGRRLFPELTVLENLEMGAYLSKSKRFVQERIESPFRIVPDPEGAEKPDGRDPERGRTAAGGDRARPGPESENGPIR